MGETESMSGLFGEEEIEEVIDSFEGNKSPGPDGYNFNFIKRFWDLMTVEVWGMMSEFYQYARLPRGLLSYLVPLIPKITNL